MRLDLPDVSKTARAALAALAMIVVGGVHTVAGTVADGSDRIEAGESVALAVNELRSTGAGVELEGARHRVEFSADRVVVAPRRGGLTWTWRLTSIGTGGAPLRGIDLNRTRPLVREPLTVSYGRGAVEERYIARAATVEQQFVIPQPLDLGQDLIIDGIIACEGRFTTVAGGWEWRGQGGAIRLGDVTALDADGRRLAASMTVGPHSTRIRVAADDLARAAYPVTVDPEIGVNDFVLSDLGPDGDDPDYQPRQPAVAYNSTDDEYLVVWCGRDVVNTVDEYEIWGQRIDAATGAQVGTNDFRISFMSIEGWNPAVAYNPVDNEYFVVWHGRDSAGGENEDEIYGRRLTGANGGLLGSQILLSDMGPAGNGNYFAQGADLVFNPNDHEYLVVWFGSDDTAGMVMGEWEIFGQRVNASTGGQVGANDFRISDVGDTGLTTYQVLPPTVAHDPVNDRYLVVWSADDPVGGILNDEFEVFGQLISGSSGAEVGLNDFRVSDMGGIGVAGFYVGNAIVTYNPIQREFLVVWTGGDDSGGLAADEWEVFGQRLDASTAAEVGVNDFRISAAGGTGNTDAYPESPAVAFDPIAAQYLVTWRQVQTPTSESEIFGQYLDGSGAEVGNDDFQISEMGPVGDGSYFANTPAVMSSSQSDESLVVWVGREVFAKPPYWIPYDDREVMGQRLIPDLLFEDDFESADWSSWSSAAP